MASVVDQANARQYNVMHMQGFKMASVRKVLAATTAILATEPPVHYIDCNGAGRNYDLPAVAGNEGLTYFIRNITGTAQTLTVRDATAATILALTQNQFAIYHCDGLAWRVIG